MRSHEEANGTKIGRASFDQPFLMEMPHLAAARVRRPYTPPRFPTHRRGFARVSTIAAMAANRLFAYLGAGAIKRPHAPRSHTTRRQHDSETPSSILFHLDFPPSPRRVRRLHRIFPVR